MEVGVVKQVDISEEMQTSYLSYAMSVIVSRALPDARDGLKPVHRRILYAMHDMGLRPDSAYKNSARIVGEVLGKYHPHGDQAVYDAMVRMAQDFSMRYPLVDGQGNFGSVDGDSPAAMRYTEARMAKMCMDVLQDIRKDTVDFSENFDGSLTEPEVLPSAVPNMLINGASGIAVGMSTSIPPHNLGEVVDALTYILDKWNRLDDIGAKDLMQFIQGPDFPTGGIIYTERGDDGDAIASAYATGRGRITLRARVHVEEMSRNRHRLVISELPYQINKSNLLERIAELHRDERVEGITDLRDESDRNGTRIVIELTRTVDPAETLAALFKLTPMQNTFSIIMLALVNGEPRLLPLKRALLVYLEHRLEVVRRRSEHDLAQARARAHILEGFLTALDNLDEVINTIRRSRTAETAHTNLRRKFKLSDEQATAVLDMPLRRLAALERKKIEDEYKEKIALIKYLEGLLSSPKKMRDVIKHELLDVKERYGDPRRTQIVSGTHTEITVEQLVPDEMSWITVTQDGTVARTISQELPKTERKPAQLPQMALEANTRDTLYLIAADGSAISLPVHQLPQSDDPTVGSHFADLGRLTRRQHLSAAVALPPEATGFLTLATLGGVVKRVTLEDLPGVTTDLFTVMGVAEDDMLGWAFHTTGQDEIMLFTAAGQAIRFAEEEVRPMGLPAGGVMGIKLQGEEDGVVSVALARPGAHVWVIADNGYAKRTPIGEYPTQGRYGQGVITMNLPRTARALAGGVVGKLEDKVTILTTAGITKTMTIKSAPDTARNRQGKRVIALAVRDQVAGVVSPKPRPAVMEEIQSPPAGPLPAKSVKSDGKSPTTRSRSRRKSTRKSEE
jgi:DNA gyrase subunit A